MNKLLAQYVVDVDYPEVSGIEHLQMLETRSKLAAIAAQLSPAEQQALATADHKLATYAVAFLVELNRFVNLAQERQQRQISPASGGGIWTFLCRPLLYPNDQPP